MRGQDRIVESEQRIVGRQATGGPKTAWPTPSGGLPGPPGSREKTSSPAAARRPLASAAASAASSTRLPRAVLTSTAPGFMRASAAASIMPTVSGVSGTWSETMSDSASSAGSARHSARPSASVLGARAV